MVAAALLTVAGPACDKAPRHEPPQREEPQPIPGRDAGARAPGPTSDLDAEVAGPDAAVPAPVVRVKLPRLSECSMGVWCAPAAQTVEFATPRAADFQGCPTALRMSKSGVRFPFDVMRSRTGAEHDAGKDLCCYTWRGRCRPVGALDDPFAGL